MHTRQKLPLLMLAALGVVFGDIGTSPLYTVRECFTATGIPLTPHNILGILSAITWALILVVTIKYVTFIMQADNRGEGGMFSLTALAIDQFGNHSSRFAILVMGLVGAALFYGDATITPAISTLSAVEGLKIIAPSLSHLIVPISLVLIMGLFAIQRYGSGKVGSMFGPIMLMWFAALAALGIKEVLHNPSVLWALNPAEFVAFAVHHPVMALLAMGSVVLAVTGGEALYADMGHFTAKPIRLTWLTLVFPALLLNYYGQGALLLKNPDFLENPFYHMVPPEVQLPMIMLATLASLIASQAVISGAFSLTHQAIQLGYLPRMHVTHTSHDLEGQIYIPAVNTLMLVTVALIVVGFQHSSNLASAYGIAVTGTMLISTLLATMVFRKRNHWSLLAIGLFTAAFTAIDATFFTANLPKIPHGGWFPLAFGGVLFVLMLAWVRGRTVSHERVYLQNPQLEDFIRTLPSNVPQVARTAVFLTSDINVVPPALLYNYTHNHVLHSQTIIMKINRARIPRYPEAERLSVHFHPRGITTVSAMYGFMESPDVPHILNECQRFGLHIAHPQQLSYFLAHHTFVPSPHPALNALEEPIFRALDALSLSAINFFNIPRNQVVEIGNQIEV